MWVVHIGEKHIQTLPRKPTLDMTFTKPTYLYLSPCSSFTHHCLQISKTSIISKSNNRVQLTCKPSQCLTPSPSFLSQKSTGAFPPHTTLPPLRKIFSPLIVSKPSQKQQKITRKLQTVGFFKVSITLTLRESWYLIST